MTNDGTTGPRRPRSRRIALGTIPAVGVLVASCSGSGPQSALEPRGEFARDIDGLWNLVFTVAVVIFFLVMAALAYSIVRFRQRKGQEERAPKQIHGNTKLEITWTILPAVVLAGIAVPTVAGVFNLRDIPEGPDVLQVEVVGHQWWWEFEYPDLGVVTANELHIPAQTDVNLTMTAADVIHSFWVPVLNGKRDLVPGRSHNLTLNADEPTPEGEPLLGQCAEFCGLAHADMRLRVYVHDDAGFEQWVAEQNEPAAIPTEGLAVAGYETFSQVCTACHQATVVNDAGVVETVGAGLAPNLTHFGSRDTFGSGTFENTEEHLAAWLRNPADLKPMDPDRNDIPAGRILGMPNFGLDAQEVAELIELLKSWR